MRLTIHDLTTYERLSVPSIHHKIQTFIREGHKPEAIAESLAARYKCSLLVAQQVVRDAEDADEYFYLSELD